MYKRKRSGPSTDPCGTPEMIGTSLEDSLLRLCLVRSSLMQTPVYPDFLVYVRAP